MAEVVILVRLSPALLPLKYDFIQCLMSLPSPIRLHSEPRGHHGTQSRVLVNRSFRDGEVVVDSQTSQCMQQMIQRVFGGIVQTG
jgi:hypothetical protein